MSACVCVQEGDVSSDGSPWFSMGECSQPRIYSTQNSQLAERGARIITEYIRFYTKRKRKFHGSLSNSTSKYMMICINIPSGKNRKCIFVSLDSKLKYSERGFMMFLSTVVLCFNIYLHSQLYFPHYFKIDFIKLF